MCTSQLFEAILSIIFLFKFFFNQSMRFNDWLLQTHHSIFKTVFSSPLIFRIAREETSKPHRFIPLNFHSKFEVIDVLLRVKITLLVVYGFVKLRIEERF